MLASLHGHRDATVENVEETTWPGRAIAIRGRILADVAPVTASAAGAATASGSSRAVGMQAYS